MTQRQLRPYRLRTFALDPSMDWRYDGGQFGNVKSRIDPRRSFVESAPIKILRIITRLNIGGPARQAITLSARLDPDRFRSLLVTGLTARDEGSLEPLARSVGTRVVLVPSLRRPLHPWHDARACWALLRTIWTQQPDIIHTHMAKAGALGRIAALLCRLLRPGYRPLLIHTFHGHVFQGYFSRVSSRIFVAIERWLAARTTRLIAVSETIREELLRYRIGCPEQIVVISVGLDLDPVLAIEPPPSTGQSVFRIGMVGRLVPVKNPALFLWALVCLRHRAPVKSIRGIIVGDGELRGALEQEARRLGLADVVSFRGWQSDLARVYGELDCVCLTSLNEGTPLALIEAMAAARPVVATDVGGVCDLLGGLEDSQSPQRVRYLQRGAVVRSGDAEGLAEALQAVAEQPSLRERWGHVGRAFVRSRFTNERLLRDLSALYADVMTPYSAPPGSTVPLEAPEMAISAGSGA